MKDDWMEEMYFYDNSCFVNALWQFAIRNKNLLPRVMVDLKSTPALLLDILPVENSDYHVAVSTLSTTWLCETNRVSEKFPSLWLHDETWPISQRYTRICALSDVFSGDIAESLVSFLSTSIDNPVEGGEAYVVGVSARAKVFMTPFDNKDLLQKVPVINLSNKYQEIKLQVKKLNNCCFIFFKRE